MLQQYLNIIPVLILIILMIVGMSFLAKRYAPGMTRPNTFLKVTASLSLGGKERMVLVQAGEDYLLLGVSPGNVQTLHVLDKAQIDNADLNEAGNSGSAFANVLQSLSRK